MSEAMAMRLGFSKMIGVGGGGDGGFIVIGPDGKIHKVPPWNPDVMRLVAAALKNHPEALKGLQTLGVIKEHM